MEIKEALLKLLKLHNDDSNDIRDPVTFSDLEMLVYYLDEQQDPPIKDGECKDFLEVGKDHREEV